MAIFLQEKKMDFILALKKAIVFYNFIFIFLIWFFGLILNMNLTNSVALMLKQNFL